MDDEHDILIEEDGTVRYVYADAVAEIFAGEPDQTTTRASHVEPHPLGGGWLADMGPSDGPVLGANGSSIETGDTRWVLLQPFPTRQAALDAERQWLREEKGL